MANPTLGSNDKSFSGAIVALLQALSQNFAPRSITDRGQNVNNAVNGSVTQPPPGAPPPSTLMPQATPGLGNQSPGLGNSF